MKRQQFEDLILIFLILFLIYGVYTFFTNEDNNANNNELSFQHQLQENISEINKSATVKINNDFNLEDPNNTSMPKNLEKNISKKQNIVLSKPLDISKIYNNESSELNETNITLVIKEEVKEEVFIDNTLETIKTQNKEIVHIISPGDTFRKLSILYGVDYRRIKELNNLTSDILYVGQVLKIKILEGNETEPRE